MWMRNVVLFLFPLLMMDVDVHGDLDGVAVAVRCGLGFHARDTLTSFYIS